MSKGLGSMYNDVIQGKSIKISRTQSLTSSPKLGFKIFTLRELKEVTHVSTILSGWGQVGKGNWQV